jgi:hypothetical protein
LGQEDIMPMESSGQAAQAGLGGAESGDWVRQLLGWVWAFLCDCEGSTGVI